MRRPTSAARIAWRSELLPSVALTSVWESRWNLYGSEPVWRTRARAFAAAIEPMLLIVAEPPAMPGESELSV